MVSLKVEDFSNTTEPKFTMAALEPAPKSSSCTPPRVKRHRHNRGARGLRLVNGSYSSRDARDRAPPFLSMRTRNMEGGKCGVDRRVALKAIE